MLRNFNRQKFKVKVKLRFMETVSQLKIRGFFFSEIPKLGK